MGDSTTICIDDKKKLFFSRFFSILQCKKNIKILKKIWKKLFFLAFYDWILIKYMGDSTVNIIECSKKLFFYFPEWKKKKSKYSNVPLPLKIKKSEKSYF